MARKPSHDEKRKKKLQERRKKEGSVDAVVPYDGNKYQGAKFALILFQAECAIRELDVVTEERLTDAQVKASLEYFVRRLRGQEPEIPEGALLTGEDDNPRDSVTEHIQEYWDELQPKLDFLPTRADQAGVLRTIITSLNTRTRMTPGGRGYLEFLGPFLAKAGFEVETQSAEERLEAGDELWKAGHRWIMYGEVEAQKEFRNLAARYSAAGRAEEVADLIDYLESHTDDPALTSELRQIRQRLGAPSSS